MTLSKIRLTLLSALATSSLCAMAYSPSYYATTSALSTGRWIKIRVTQPGMQQIDYATLRSWGFTDPAKVKVCGYGGSLLSTHRFDADLPDDVRATYSLHTADGRVLFYGDTDVRTVIKKVQSTSSCDLDVQRNYYASGGCYLLTDSDVPAASQPVPYTASTAAAVTSHLAVELFEPEVQNPTGGGAVYHGPRMEAGQTATLPFSVNGWSTEADPAGLTNFKGFLHVTAAANQTGSLATYNPTVSAPGSVTLTPLSTMSILNISASSTLVYNNGTYRGRVTGPAEDGRLDFQLLFPAGANVAYAALDRAVLVYPRVNTLSAQQPQLAMQYSNVRFNGPFSIAGATERTHILNVTNPADVREQQGEYRASEGTYTASFDKIYATSAGLMVAFDEGGTFPVPQLEGEVENQNIHGHATPDMIIVTTAQMLPYAQQLADMHRRAQNMEVNVYTQQQVYNEFSSGTYTPMGIRRMVKMFRDREPSKLRYLLLYGPAIADMRALTTPHPVEYLATYEVEPVGTQMPAATRNHNSCFASDTYYGMLSDGFVYEAMASSNVEIGVGRIPAETPAQAEAVNRKVAAHLDAPGNVQTYCRAITISDDGNENSHLEQSLAVGDTITSLQKAMTVYSAHNLIYPFNSGDAREARKLISSTLSAGAGYMTYSGHGRPDGLTAEKIWSLEAVRKNLYTHQPLVMLATCDTYEMDRNNTGLAEGMVLQPDGGAIGVVAACREVYMEYNQLLNLSMAAAYASAPAGACTGDIYRTAHNSAIANSFNADSRFNTLCFNLCGDPAIPVNTPAHTAVLTSVNGTEPGSEKIAVLSEAPVTLTGEIRNAEGAIVTDFSGTAHITLFEAPHTVSIYNRHSDDKAGNVTVDHHTLCQATVPVKNGRWEATITAPAPIYQGAYNRLVMTASTTDADGQPVSAAGMSRALQVTNGPVAETPASLPQVEAMYLDTPDFVDGDVTGASVTLHAAISGGSNGLNTSSAIGMRPQLLLDGTQTIQGADGAMQLASDGTASLSLPIANLNDGSHTLTLSVCDNTGNRVSRSIGFTVITQAARAWLTSNVTTVRTEAQIQLSHDMDAELGTPEIRLIIKDMHGNTVKTVNNAPTSYTWLMDDNAGQPVPDGPYTVTATLRAGQNMTGTAPLTLTVVRPIN